MTITRREAIAIGASGIATALAGCQALTSSDDSMMDLKVTNYTPDQQSIVVRIIDPEKTEWPEAVEYRLPQNGSDFEMPPASEGEENNYTANRFEDIAEPKRYTVEAWLHDDSTAADWKHFHYIPSGNDGEQIWIGIYQDEQKDDSIIDFRRV